MRYISRMDFNFHRFRKKRRRINFDEWMMNAISKTYFSRDGAVGKRQQMINMFPIVGGVFEHLDRFDLSATFKAAALKKYDCFFKKRQNVTELERVEKHNTLQQYGYSRTTKSKNRTQQHVGS